jgi:hypothetical protein
MCAATGSGACAHRSAELMRKNQLIFSSVILLIAVIYCVACLSPFYMPSGIKFESDVPEDAKKIILEWHKNSEIRRPEPFSVERCLYFLKPPYRREGVDSLVKLAPIQQPVPSIYIVRGGGYPRMHMFYFDNITWVEF